MAPPQSCGFQRVSTLLGTVRMSSSWKPMREPRRVYSALVHRPKPRMASEPGRDFQSRNGSLQPVADAVDAVAAPASDFLVVPFPAAPAAVWQRTMTVRPLCLRWADLRRRPEAEARRQAPRLAAT